MTLEEAIKHNEEVAESEEQKYKDWKGDYSHLNRIESCLEYASEHRQLAEWLKELKKYRAIFEKIGKLLCEYGYTMDDLDTIFGKVNEEVKDDADSD